MRRPSNHEAAGLVAGFALWSAGFAALYGAHGLICATGAPFGATGARAALIGLWAVMIAAHAALIVWFYRRARAATPDSRFVRTASLMLAIAALGTTVWTGLPVIGLSIC